jgi:hypothetical protein
MRLRGTTEVDPDELTAWAIDEGRMEDQPISFFRRARKELIQAMRADEGTDAQGRTGVRKMLALRQTVKIKRKKIQKWLWIDLYEASPRKAHIALSQQRRGFVAWCRKHKQTVESYNANNKHGAQIPLFDYNINRDLAEEQQPTEYPDERPTGGD